jgi:hypothetical protein
MFVVEVGAALTPAFILRAVLAPGRPILARLFRGDRYPINAFKQSFCLNAAKETALLICLGGH